MTLASAEESPTLPASLQPATSQILVVDDDAPTRLVLTRLLQRQGYSVTQAADGFAALQCIAVLRPDLVLLDVMMPQLDGFAACAQIRRDDGDDSLPVIMLTGADEIEAIESAFNAGATDFITKPINWALLSERVRYALRSGALNREVRRSRRREESLRRIAGLGYWELQIGRDLWHWGPELQAHLGLEPADLERTDALLARVPPADQPRLRTALQLACEFGQRLEVEFRLRHGAQEHVLRLVGERGSQGTEAQVLMGVFQDLTQTRRTEALVDYLALHDEVTGLGNRRWFMRQVEQTLAQAAQLEPSAPYLVGVVDVTRLERHNETLGRAACDRLLLALGQRLNHYLQSRGGGALARIDGSAFGVCFGVADAAAAQASFEHLLKGLAAPFRHDEQNVFLNFSAGWALFPLDASAAEPLLNKAQQAQRLARKQARTLRRAEGDEQALKRQQQDFELERDLHQALEREQFFLLYQPQLDFAQRRISGAEALLRWQHPQHGVVPPVRFIGLLEETGLINAVGHWVMQQACAQAAQWQQSGLALRVGLNMSPRQFLQPDLLEQVQRALISSAVRSDLVELEITESLAMQDVAHTTDLLQRLRQLGLKVAIDDFGVGHSALEYLLHFPIDVIKVDRAFVRQITSRVGDRAIVRAICVMAQTLGLEVIAEGVEDQRQCDFLEALGVHQIQGYLIGKPMPPAALEQLARSLRYDG